MRKECFKNRVGNIPRVTDKPITKIIDTQLDINRGQFIQEELTLELTKLKAEKLQASTKYPQNYGRQGNLMTYFFDFATPSVNGMQERERDGQKAVSSPSLEMVTSKSPRTTEA